MLRVGLTGGIGSGKSCVGRLLVERGAVLVDADVVAREVVAPGTDGLREVVAAFGEGVLAPGGSLDREGLARLVFPDPAALARLNAIVHPRVRRRTAELVTRAEAAGASVLVHDLPLLVEQEMQSSYDVVVVVDLEPETALHRLVEQRGMDPDDARARMARQVGRRERLAAAHEVVDNAAGPQELRTAVEALWERLEVRSRALAD